jgi:hypothetical protein
LQVSLLDTCGRSCFGELVKFTVTPLGGARSDIGRVVDGIVRYLQPKGLAGPTPDSPARGIEGPSRYYADSGEEPGRWLGRAADAAGLRGVVRRDDFAAVLSGRDPRTGERLITAQGSAGRRPKLGAGTPTRTGLQGDALYGEADAATALGITKAEAARMLDVGTALAQAQTTGDLTEDRVGGRVTGRAKGRASGRVSTFGQVTASTCSPLSTPTVHGGSPARSWPVVKRQGRPVSILRRSAPAAKSTISYPSVRRHASPGSPSSTSVNSPNITRTTGPTSNTI